MLCMAAQRPRHQARGGSCPRRFGQDPPEEPEPSQGRGGSPVTCMPVARDLCFEYGSNADTERGMLYIVGLGCAAIVAGCVRST